MLTHKNPATGIKQIVAELAGSDASVCVFGSCLDEWGSEFDGNGTTSCGKSGMADCTTRSQNYL